tara:strand:+ start:155 stop:481 length:327 start_codon:yes stop_codon:yes gene_type:complete
MTTKPTVNRHLSHHRALTLLQHERRETELLRYDLHLLRARLNHTDPGGARRVTEILLSHEQATKGTDARVKPATDMAITEALIRLQDDEAKEDAVIRANEVCYWDKKK